MDSPENPCLPLPCRLPSRPAWDSLYPGSHIAITSQGELPYSGSPAQRTPCNGRSHSSYTVVCIFRYHLVRPRVERLHSMDLNQQIVIYGISISQWECRSSQASPQRRASWANCIRARLSVAGALHRPSADLKLRGVRLAAVEPQPHGSL